MVFHFDCGLRQTLKAIARCHSQGLKSLSDTLNPLKWILWLHSEDLPTHLGGFHVSAPNSFGDCLDLDGENVYVILEELLSPYLGDEKSGTVDPTGN